MKIGYARVSTHDQNLDLQTDALHAAGVEKVFTDKASGAKVDRKGWNELLGHARAGDVVVIWRLDRMARSLKHLTEILSDFERRDIQLISLTENMDTTTAAGKMVFHIFGAVAEFEKNLIVERTQAGLAAARSRGMKGGRKPVLDDAKKNAADAMKNEGKEIPEIARAVGTSPRTIRRYFSGEYNQPKQGAAV